MNITLKEQIKQLAHDYTPVVIHESVERSSIDNIPHGFQRLLNETTSKDAVEILRLTETLRKMIADEPITKDETLDMAVAFVEIGTYLEQHNV